MSLGSGGGGGGGGDGEEEEDCNFLVIFPRGTCLLGWCISILPGPNRRFFVRYYHSGTRG